MKEEFYIGNLKSRAAGSTKFHVNGFVRGVSGDVFSFDELSIEIRDEINVLVQKYENELSFPVEVLFSIDGKKVKVLSYKKQRLNSKNLVLELLNSLEQGDIDEREMLRRIDLSLIDDWFAKKIEETDIGGDCKIGSFPSISSGIGSGVVCFTREQVINNKKVGKKSILILKEVHTDDFNFFTELEGVILPFVGDTSHAAVITRGLGIPALICEDFNLLEEYENTDITIDANKGAIYKGFIKSKYIIDRDIIDKIIEIAKKHTRISVFANADDGESLKSAIRRGADGLGLCRTEHMFTESDSVNLIRQILFTESDISESTILNLRSNQEGKLRKIFEVHPKVAIIRLLDAPMHEFIPRKEKDLESLARSLGLERKVLEEKIFSMTESNPMLGYRGARMLLLNKKILRAQVEAILNAASGCGYAGVLGIEIPLVLGQNEVLAFSSFVKDVIKEGGYDKKKIDIELGAMVETPRALFEVDKYIDQIDFISFGTNDLSQFFSGVSRDDSQIFMNRYVKKSYLPRNIFKGLDPILLDYINSKISSIKDKKIALCGEQAGDQDTIRELLECSNFTHLSVSPSRISKTLIMAAHFSVLQ